LATQITLRRDKGSMLTHEEMDNNFALEDYEVAAGYILSCQSFPLTDKVVLDYDQP